jgi:hypothetical protein
MHNTTLFSIPVEMPKLEEAKKRLEKE